MQDWETKMELSSVKLQNTQNSDLEHLEKGSWDQCNVG